MIATAYFVAPSSSFKSKTSLPALLKSGASFFAAALLRVRTEPSANRQRKRPPSSARPVAAVDASNCKEHQALSNSSATAPRHIEEVRLKPASRRLDSRSVASSTQRDF